MALTTYRAKRDFTATPEPRGKRAKTRGDAFVVQKHDARRLHYDFRLELDGVLKSWAVTRGPSLVPGEKRLAVHVEDHPTAYGDFEGTIPKGDYGGGAVIVWDRGTWAALGDAHKGYAKGHLEFELHGEKLRGRWHLVRMHPRPAEKKDNWLLIKADDSYARAAAAEDILEEAPNSVKSGRDIHEVAVESPPTRASPTSRGSKPHRTKPDHPKPEAPPIEGAKRRPQPEFVEPMLAALTASPPAGDRWLHEIKFDGYRLQARIEAGKVTLFTRSGQNWTTRFGSAIPAVLRDLPALEAIIDGELVVEGASGASDFSALQADLAEARSDRFVFYAFDLLYLDGNDLREAPLAERKQRLQALIGSHARLLRFSEHLDEPGELVLRHACRLGLEGVVSKLRSSPYRSGRGKHWVKSKCSARQEFVIAGFAPSTTSRKAIGSLALGVHEGDALRYVGKVGTGFTAPVAEDLFRRLDRIASAHSPFAKALGSGESRGLRYVKPELVAEVEFRAWTADGHLRHASFRGLREDKPAREIVRETGEFSPRSNPPKRAAMLTHPDRLYWPDQGVTKQGLADYYTDIWRYIEPFIVDRPLSLLRCPTGIEGQSFFQKHAWKGLSPAIRQVADPETPEGPPSISISDLEGLIGLVQAAVLEIHPWASTLENWEQPDSLTLDLDPGDGVAWASLIDAALEVRERLKQAGLAAFVKTTGGKGLHVVAPLKPRASWTDAKAFSRKLAEEMVADAPDRYVATIAKVKRRGKILIDYLRNQRGATAVAAYSTRARPGATVSMPLEWEELTDAIGPGHFTILNAPARMASLKTIPWADFRNSAVPLETPKPRKRSSR